MPSALSLAAASSESSSCLSQKGSENGSHGKDAVTGFVMSPPKPIPTLSTIFLASRQLGRKPQSREGIRVPFRRREDGKSSSSKVVLVVLAFAISGHAQAAFCVGAARLLPR